MSTRRRLAFLTALAVGAATFATAQPAVAAAPVDGLVAAYDFRQPSGATVPNTAMGSSFGPATVRNVQSADWTASGLTMRGGAKTSTGNWVELPDDILAGDRSATVVAEVKASQAMLNSFHFLWNVGNESAATEYFFASLNCGSGRTPLVGVKSDGVERLVGASSCGVAADQWVNVASVVDGAAGRASLYLDGVRVADAAIDRTPADVRDQSLNTIGRAPWPDPLFQGAISAFRVYDRALSATEVAATAQTDAETHATELRAQAQAILDALALKDISTSADIDLPTSGGRVTWTSSNPALVAPDGTVTAPVAGQPGGTAQLTATAAVRGVTATRTITVTVTASTETAAQRAARLAGRFVIPSVLESGSTLPTAPEGTTVAVRSTDGGVVVTDGVVSGADGSITVRVTDIATGATADRTFAVTVLPADSTAQLLAYNRVPTLVTEANNADVALSMHLAVGEDDAWRPLNENYGIFFPKTAVPVPANGPRDGDIRSLRDPHLFTLEDGGYGVVATRTARGGGADGTQTSSMLFARSADLRSYDEVGMVDLGVTSGVNDPAAVYDSAADRYVVSWTSDAGAAMYTSFADLGDVSTRGEVRRGEVAATVDVDEAEVANFDSGNTVPVDADTLAALEVRFGRVANTGVTAPARVEIAQGATVDAAALAKRVELSYSDGSKATRPVTWDAASIGAVDTSTPGTYEVTGTIKQPEYATPFADERADPSVFRYDLNGQQKFLMIATEDIYGGNIDPQGGAHMPIRIANSIEDLSDDAIRAGRNVEVDLLRRGDTDAEGRAMTGCFWAPEYHVIGGRLSILFMPCYDGANGRPDMFTGQASIIQLKKDAQGRDLDPAVPANWTKAQKVLRAGGGILNPVQTISLDMTYVEDSGQSYYVWQQLGALFIARMDPADPTRLTSEPVRILAPEYAWDNVIAEGPNVYARDGKLYLIYSGSTVGDTYTTGLALATAGENVDLTSPSAWSKLNYPIQKSGVFNGSWQLGTGHGMWSQDEDDNLLYVFHARTDNNNLSGRDMFVRRVHFAVDGLPIFDMESTEEVAPDNRRVTATVVVTAPAGLEVTGAVSSRCIAGKVTQTVTVRNAEGFPVTVTAKGPYGTKTFGALAAGKSSSAAFTTRAGSIPAGTVTVDAAATVNGKAVTDTVSVPFAAASCG
ncbi:GH43 family beta-xylosidase [Microbacterium proteolyticum]|uniref:GH43 family beta-xylosidase n=1 Tax=Microbacterium proteolyticum TaxID=1572644 RepID=A0A7W5CHJ7_9MICO|nr:GH43 family beta-xylosidase [Microbacterium proteolyticum]